jgi:aspartate dehydrogenase
MDSKLDLGIVGCGAIGSEIARAVDRGALPYALFAICDSNPSKAQALRDSLAHERPHILELPQFGDECDVVIECASADAVRDVAIACVNGCCVTDLIVMSVGGITKLTDDDFRLLEDADVRLHIPSGAVGGIDALCAMRESGLTRVSLTTRKPPAALGMDDACETIVFEGGAEDAVAAFPKNINIAMAIRLAIGRETPFTVRIISDPNATANTHTIEAESKAGTALMVFENLPHPDMPRTSLLAPMSAIALLRRIADSMSVGS